MKYRPMNQQEYQPDHLGLVTQVSFAPIACIVCLKTSETLGMFSPLKAPVKNRYLF